MSLVITYETDCFQLIGFCDVSWGNNREIGKSTPGYLFMMAVGPQLQDRAPERGGAISYGGRAYLNVLASKEVAYLLN